MKTCAICDKEGKALSSCCKQVMYCGQECANKHWNAGHKFICNNNKRTLEGNEENEEIDKLATKLWKSYGKGAYFISRTPEDDELLSIRYIRDRERNFVLYIRFYSDEEALGEKIFRTLEENTGLNVNREDGTVNMGKHNDLSIIKLILSVLWNKAGIRWSDDTVGFEWDDVPDDDSESERERRRNIILVSGDGVEVSVNRNMAKRASKTLSDMMEFAAFTDRVDLPNILGSTLKLIEQIMKKPDIQFRDMDIAEWVKLVSALNYLDMSYLSSDELWNVIFNKKDSRLLVDGLSTESIEHLRQFLNVPEVDPFAGAVRGILQGNNDDRSQLFPYEELELVVVPKETGKLGLLDVPKPVVITHLFTRLSRTRTAFLNLCLLHPTLFKWGREVKVAQLKKLYPELTADMSDESIFCAWLNYAHGTYSLSSKSAAKEFLVLSDGDLALKDFKRGGVDTLELFLKAFRKHKTVAGIRAAAEKRAERGQAARERNRKKKEDATALTEQRRLAWMAILEPLGYTGILAGSFPEIDPENITAENPEVVAFVNNLEVRARGFVERGQFNYLADHVTKAKFKELINKYL